MADLPLPARLYFAVLVLSVVGLMAGLLRLAAPPDRATLAQAAVGVALLTAAWLYPLSHSFKIRIHLGTSVLIAAIVLLPPGLAMIVAGAGTLLAHLIRRQDWVESTFNVAQTMAQAAVGGLILVAFDGRIPHRPEAVAYVLLAGMAMFVVNNLLVATMIALQTRRPLLSSWRESVLEVSRVEFLGHVTEIGIGVFAVFLLATVPWTLPLLVLPTIAIYIALRGRIRLRQDAEAARIEGNAGPAAAQRVALLGNWEWNLNTGDSSWSEETYRILGLRRNASEPSYEALLRSVHPDDRVRVNLTIHQALRTGEAFHFAHRIRLPDGTQRIMEQQGEIVPDGAGGVSRLTATIQDVTERKTLEAQLARQALHDPVTDFPNRAFALDHVAKLLASRRPEQEPLAVVLVDVEGIGTQLAGETRDSILLEVARRLRACLQNGEMVARFGVTQFMAVLESVAADTAMTRAADIRDSLRVPLDLAGHDVLLDVSVGAAVSNPTVELPQDLVRAAEADLTRAKAKNHVSSVSLVPEGYGVHLAPTELQGAADRGELHLYYQPELRLAAGEIVGFEALIRWRHPTGRWLLPAEFLPVADTSGQTIPIGRWVLKEACRTARAWPMPAGSERPPTVSVNIASEHFRDPGFVADVAHILDQAALDPTVLRLELTELTVIEDLDASNRTMEALRNLGVRFTIDDLGASYASLGYLHRLPIDAFKLDRSLIAPLEIGDADRAIVQATASLAHTFGLLVAAKGIETPLQLALANALGCDQGQGYFFAPPLDRKQLQELLTRAEPLVDFAPAMHPGGSRQQTTAAADLAVT
jgi:diguanylate cyclase (GGDEF)-like protein/PAS domain S-box-containing protein